MAIAKAPELPSLIVQRSGRRHAYVMTYKNKWVYGRSRHVESHMVGRV